MVEKQLGATLEPLSKKQDPLGIFMTTAIYTKAVGTAFPFRKAASMFPPLGIGMPKIAPGVHMLITFTRERVQTMGTLVRGQTFFL
jgi:hypothetical protein